MEAGFVLQFNRREERGEEKKKKKRKKGELSYCFW